MFWDFLDDEDRLDTSDWTLGQNWKKIQSVSLIVQLFILGIHLLGIREHNERSLLVNKNFF